MSRSAIRRMQKAEAKKIRQESRKQTTSERMFDQGYDVGFREGAKYAAARINRLFTTAFVASLYDRFRFVKRNKEVLDIVYAQLEDIAKDPELEGKVREWIKKKTGIDVDDYTGCRWLDFAPELGMQDPFQFVAEPVKVGEKVDV